MRAAAACLLAACASTGAATPPGGASLRAELRTADGAAITLLRWTPARGVPRRLLVVPELGFDPALFAPLCRRLRDSGWDVATLVGRHAGVADSRAEWSAWTRDVARAAGALQPGLHILAIGVGGAVAWPVAAAEGAVGIVAVNVPLRWETSGRARDDALRLGGFDPAYFVASGRAPVLLGAGRRTPAAAMRELSRAVRPVPQSLARDIADRFASGMHDDLPAVPVRMLVSARDNLVPPEDALGLDDGRPAFAAARRMGRIELFDRDYGHLDWLADPDALRDVFPVLLAELDALP